MKNTTKESTHELLNNLDKQHSKSEQIFERKNIKDTPFQLISNKDEKQYFAVLGGKRVTEIYDNPEKPQKEVSKITWNNLMIVMTELIKMENELTKTIKHEN